MCYIKKTYYTMIKCNCENQNCKHNVYLQPPRSVSQQKRTTYVQSNSPMVCESEQKISYTNISSHFNTPVIILPNKINCFGDYLKLSPRYPFESTQHSCYKQRKSLNKLIIVKPKDHINLLGYGSIELNTTPQIEFQKKFSSEQSKKFYSLCFEYNYYIISNNITSNG